MNEDLHTQFEAAAEQANQAAAMREANHADQDQHDAHLEHPHDHAEHAEGHGPDCADCSYMEAVSHIDQPETHDHGIHGIACGCETPAQARDHIDKPAAYDHTHHHGNAKVAPENPKHREQHDYHHDEATLETSHDSHDQHNYDADHTHHAGCGHIPHEAATTQVIQSSETDAQTFLANMQALRMQQTQTLKHEARVADLEAEAATDEQSGQSSTARTTLEPAVMKNEFVDNATRSETATGLVISNESVKSGGSVAFGARQRISESATVRQSTNTNISNQADSIVKTYEQASVDAEIIKFDSPIVDMLTSDALNGFNQPEVPMALDATLPETSVDSSLAAELDLLAIDEHASDASDTVSQKIPAGEDIVTSIAANVAVVPDAEAQFMVAGSERTGQASYAKNSVASETNPLIMFAGQELEANQKTSNEATMAITPTLRESLRQLATELSKVTELETELFDEKNVAKVRNELLTQAIHYLPPSERNDYVQALAQGDYTQVLSFLEKMFEQSTAGLFQEQPLIAIATFSITATFASILGKLALMVVPLSLAA